MATIPVQDDGTGTTGIIVGRRHPLAAPPIYFETLGSAIEAWYEHLAKVGARKHGTMPELSLPEFTERWRPMYACETQQHSIAMIKTTGAIYDYMIVSVYRLDSGRYEVTAYLS